MHNQTFLWSFEHYSTSRKSAIGTKAKKFLALALVHFQKYCLLRSLPICVASRASIIKKGIHSLLLYAQANKQAVTSLN